MRSYINVMGVDPSFANWGMAVMTVNMDSGAVESLERLKLVETEKDGAKSIRRSSDDLRRAQELRHGFHGMIREHDVRMVFVEVPTGTQSARASWALGIAVGVLASCPVPMIQMNPNQVKLDSCGIKNAAKNEMIAWAVGQWPNANWLRMRGHKLLNKNEHLADAVACVHAGVKTDQFQQALTMMRSALGAVA